MSTIDNDTFGKLVTGTDDNDSIKNNHLKVTISAGAGDDTINNTRHSWATDGVYDYGRGGDSVSIDGGAGNDSLSGGAGKDILSAALATTRLAAARVTTQSRAALATINSTVMRVTTR